MLFTKPICVYICLMLLCPLHIAHAAIPAPPTGKAHYTVYWLNSHIGDINAEITRENNLYTLTTHLDSHGLPRRLFKFWMHNASHLLYKPNNTQLISNNTTIESRLKKTYRIIKLIYNTTTQTLTHESVTPPDDQDKRPAVPDILKHTTIDPHSAVLHAHQEIHQALQKNYQHFLIPIYDGRRRANLYFTLIGKTTINHHDTPTPVIHLQLQRDVLSGATDTERERMQEEEPIIDIYLEDTERLFPLKAIAKAPIGSVVAIRK